MSGSLNPCVCRFALCGLVAGLTFSLLTPSALAQPAAAKPAAEARPAFDDAFARALYGKLAAQPGNVVASPASIEACLLLAYAGARGQTAAEMAQALQLDGQADVARLLDKCRQRLESDAASSGKNRLVVANSAWLQAGFPIHPQYRELLEKHAHAPIELVEFVHQPDAARRQVNTWVEDQTRQKIKDLLPADSVTSLTRLVLVNAVYFLGSWQSPFAKDQTRVQPFTRPGRSSVDAPLMHQVNRFSYAETDAYQVVELPYAESSQAMVIWLPRQADALPTVEKELLDRGLTASLAALSAKRVDLSLPKFKTHSTIALKPTLEALGMRQAFTDDADFQGITSEPLHISAVFHQAVIELDEEKTEAAAATGAVMVTRMAPQPEEAKVFRADHPFLFAIRNRTTGDILFIGRVVTPE